MKTKSYLLLTILLIVMIFAFGCATQQQKPETPSAEKTNPSQDSQQTQQPAQEVSKKVGNAEKTEGDDFGCWPPSCSVIPDPSGEQMCNDWKSGRKVSWPSDCNYFSGQPACQKLCEFETSSAPVKQQKVAEQKPVSPPTPCDQSPLQRQFTNTPYYTGPLIDDHFHMPQMREISNNPDAPVLDKDVSGHDVICLFNKERVKNVFAFYGIPIDIKEKSLQSIREIEQESPGTIIHFIELVSFPGYPVVPPQVEEILNSNPDLFKGYGEISLYLDFYHDVKPNDPTMRELYTIAEKHHLIVMMHPVSGQEQETEEVLRDYPNTQFLFHGAEHLPSASMYFDTFLEKYPNVHYSVDTTLFGDNSVGRPMLDDPLGKQDFITQFKQSWQSTLNKKVAFWKSKIEKHPNQILWGTDRGHYPWHYDPEVEALIEEYGRAFIGQLDPSVQEKYAYKNAEDLLQER